MTRTDLASVSTLIGAPLTFFSAAPGTLPDSSGQGVGFTTRLSGTGPDIHSDDPNLTPERHWAPGLWEESTSRSERVWSWDCPQQTFSGSCRQLSAGIGATDDFAVSATFSNIQYSQAADQVGIFVGNTSASVFRAGALSDGAAYLFDVQNSTGVDINFDGNTVLAPLPGDNVTFTISRTGGVWSLNVANATNPSRSGSVAVTQPTYLNGLSNLIAGVYAANPGNGVSKTETVSSFLIGTPLQTVGAVTTTTSLTSSANPAFVNQTLAFTGLLRRLPANRHRQHSSTPRHRWGSANLALGIAVSGRGAISGASIPSRLFTTETQTTRCTVLVLTQTVSYPPIKSSLAPARRTVLCQLRHRHSGGQRWLRLFLCGHGERVTRGVEHLSSGGTISGTPAQRLRNRHGHG